MNKTIVFDMYGIIYSHDKNNDIKNSKNEFDEINLDFNSIKEALNHQNNKLNIFSIDGAIEKILYHIKNQDKIVIVSTSSIQTQKLILNFFLKNEKLLDNIDFHSSSQFGSKSDAETWHQILKNYENISELYEDTKEYLDAAKYAVIKLGNKFCQFSNKI